MYHLFKKIFFSLDPETAHHVVKVLSKTAPTTLIRSLAGFEHPTLAAKLGETKLKNPIGLAAGFDKNGEMIPFLEALGFGFLELGSVTALACAGNPKPRIFRLPEDESLINWMGLPNIGANDFVKNFKSQKDRIPCGLNISKTPDFAFEAAGQKTKTGIADFLETYEKLAKLGEYTVFNLSCPNTGESVLFESPELFPILGREIIKARRHLKDKKPVLLKLSPDLGQKDLVKVVEEALKLGFDGFVVTNTTRSRAGLKTPLKGEIKNRGGLSGRGLKKAANAQLKRIFDITGKNALLIAVGGIMSFEDLLEKFNLGASLCQIYTGLIYNGPFFVKELNQKLAKFCEKNNLKSYRELVGMDLRY